MNDQNQDIDLRRPEGIDEAEFATQFYKEQWVFEQYQEDRINLFRSVLFDLKLPEGHVVMFGSHNNKVFKTWCDHWGDKRCLGFELYNEEHRKNVVVMDVRGLGDWCSTPIALCWNDIGSWERTPDARMVSYRWTIANMVKGGYYLERGNHVAGWDLQGSMLHYGFAKIESVLNGAYVLYQKK